MKAQDIHKDDTFIISPGRSVLTAKRGMAHAGGKITLRDLRTDDPAGTMAGFVKSGKVSVDKEAVLARKAKAADAKKREKEAIAEGIKRREAADKVAADKVAADKVAADKAPATQAEIIGAILMLDKDNTEHWMENGDPMVAAIETVLGKGISAKQRDEAVAATASAAK